MTIAAGGYPKPFATSPVWVETGAPDAPIDAVLGTIEREGRYRQMYVALPENG